MTVTAYDSSSRTARIDAIVATFASAGRRRRRRDRLRRGLLGATGVAALAVTIIVLAGIRTVEVSDGHAGSQLAGTAQQGRALQAEREAIDARLAELETRLAGIDKQSDTLEQQRVRLQQQGDRLERLLLDADSEEQSVAEQRGHGILLDQEIAAVAAQREALAKRWEQFEAQGELLALEIMAVNAQRKELEAQRLQIDQQQRELAELLERAEGLYRRAAESEIDRAEQDIAARTQADAGGSTYTYNSLVADVNELIVDNGELEKMRGGFSIGDGLDVSFGFMQTGAINGVEQYQNNFTIDSMASGFDSVDMSNMNSVVLQNGTGNFVSQDVMDSLADNFGSIIQNTLDDQVISTTTIYDISLHNVPGAIQGLSGEQALHDSLSSFR